MNYKKSILILFIGFLCPLELSAQDFTTYFITPELRINFKKPSMEFRYRQLDYYAPWGVYRTELMSGAVLWGGKIKVYNHTRLDNGTLSNRRLRLTTGIRLDWNATVKIADRPLSINNQIRRFVPLNANGAHQYVFVQDYSWMMNKRIWPSLLGFMTASKSTMKDTWSDPSWWFGPGVVIQWIPGKLNTYTCFLPDVLDRQKPYVFLRLQYKLQY